MDMDHHCFFLSNCVGRNNLRYFFLFLGWTLLGSIYVVSGVLCLLIKRRDVVVECLKVASFTDGMLFWLRQIYYTVLIAPGWVQTCAFMLTSASAGLVGTASLLKSQSALLLAGKTYISTLTDSPAKLPQKVSMTQLLSMLANQASWKHIWPAWHTELHVGCTKEL